MDKYNKTGHFMYTVCTPIAQQTVARRQISIEYESIPCVSNTEVSSNIEKEVLNHTSISILDITRTVRHQHNLFQQMLTLRQLSVPNFSSILPKARVVRWFFDGYVHMYINQSVSYSYILVFIVQGVSRRCFIYCV